MVEQCWKHEMFQWTNLDLQQLGEGTRSCELHNCQVSKHSDLGEMDSCVGAAPETLKISIIVH